MKNQVNRKSIELEAAKCPLCRQTKSTRILESEDRLHLSVPEGVRCILVKCDNCGMRYLNPRVADTDIVHFYPEGEYYTHLPGRSKNKRRKLLNDLILAQACLRHNYPRQLIRFSSDLPEPLIKAASWVASRLNPFRFRRILPYQPDGRVFELGFGNGAYLMTLSDLGWECWGAELDSTTVERAKNHGITAFANVADSRIPEKQFDWVTSYHSLEHVYDPVEVLQRLFNLLKPGGHIFVGVPNGDSLMARVFGSNWYNLGVPIHVQVFSQRTLLAALKQVGFVEIEIRHWSLTYGLLGSIQFALNDWLWRTTGRKRVANFLQDSRVIQLLVLPVIKLLDILGKGDAIEAVARKPRRNI